MSVALDWHIVGGPAHVRRGSQAWPEAIPVARRPQLTLVPYVAPAVRRRSVLTRRGRLARTLVLGTVLLAVLLWRLAPLAAPVELTADRAVTVRSGQSLSDVAAEQLPGLSVDEGIRRIQVLNDLPGTGVYAGQPLLIPAQR